MAQARKPAVEPVTGISIDDYKEVPPSEAQGYDWNKGQNNQANRKPKSVEQAPVNTDELPQKEIETVSTPDLTPAVVLLFMLSLPFGIWFFLLGKLEKPENEVGFQEDEDLDNTLAFPGKSKTESNKDDDDDFDIPKAS